jgi:hypothetical protein
MLRSPSWLLETSHPPSPPARFRPQALFKQLFRFVKVQLFNQLLLRRECCSFSNGEYVKTGLEQLRGEEGGDEAAAGWRLARAFGLLLLSGCEEDSACAVASCAPTRFQAATRPTPQSHFPFFLSPRKRWRTGSMARGPTTSPTPGSSLKYL